MAKENSTMALSPRQTFNGQRVLRIPGCPITIATWNVTSLFQAGKLDNVTKEMDRLNIDILGLSDVQWPGKGEIPIKDGYMYYVGGNDNYHRYGVAFLVKNNIQKSVINVVHYSERLILLQLKAYSYNINLIQAYAPTKDKSDDEIEEFYSHLEKILKITKSRDVTIVLGDFNAKVGEGSVDGVVGSYGLGERNERGDRLIEFCQCNNMTIMNTWFKLPKRRLYTWTSPKHTEQKIIRNQIDFVLINSRYRNSITSVKAYPGADINSNHNPLIAKFRIKLKKTKKKTRNQGMDTGKLRDDKVREELTKEIQSNLNNIARSNKETTDANEKWNNIKKAIIEPSGEKLKYTWNNAKQVWMNQEIIVLMEERRKYKGRNMEKYREIHKQIRKKIRIAKETYMEEKCKEVEEMERKNDMFNMHKKIKEITGIGRKKHKSIIKDKDGNLILDIKARIKRWEEYIEELFYEHRTKKADMSSPRKSHGHPITKEEVVHAIRNSKSGKAVGPDELPVELIKLIKEDNLDVLIDLFNIIYETGIIPQEWITSTFVMLPKKENAKECSEHRSISLMSHTLKILLKIIHNRLYKKLEQDIGETQFGFCNGLGTRDALFAINVLTERCRDVSVELYLCFIDYEKAFDNVNHAKLMSILKEKDIEERAINLIENLYWNQKATIRIEQETSKEIDICKGVRQGCILSPILFNLYSEVIFRQALSEVTMGVIVNGRVINNIRYADDTVIIATNMTDLQLMMERIHTHSLDFGLKMNLKKTKYMVISKAPFNVYLPLIVNNVPIERVNKYQYLGTTMNQELNHTTEINKRIEMARMAFMKMKSLLTNKSLNLNMRVRMVRCYIFSILLYGAEAWTLKKENIKKIESFEMWIYRRLLKISWMARVTNDEVLQMIGKDKEVVFSVQRRKLEYFGHIMRGPKYDVLQLIIQGKIEGRRSVGRRRISWLQNLRKWFNCTSLDLFRAATSKIRIAMMIANLHRETAH